MKNKLNLIPFRAILFLSLFLFSNCNTLNSELRALEKLEVFRVSENENAFLLDGVINTEALEKFQLLHQKYPNIKQIKIINCDGSINDEINLQLAKYIHKNKFHIHLEDNGLIASGGTDLFLAGQKRTKGKNTRIGVHSWEEKRKTATDYPKGHPVHQSYIEYFQFVGFSRKKAEDFYYFTINAAPAESMHWMTDAEIERFGMLVD